MDMFLLQILNNCQETQQDSVQCNSSLILGLKPRHALQLNSYYSRSKGKEIKKYGQGCIADTLTK